MGHVLTEFLNSIKYKYNKYKHLILAGGEIILAGGKKILAGGKIILAGGKIILAGQVGKLF